MKINFKWLAPVLICLIASVVALFLPVLKYVYPNGNITSFNVLSFFEPEDLENILSYYSGPINVTVDRSVATILAIIAMLAILAAFIGVITMSMQRPNFWQFILALTGIIGTMIPSLLIFLAVILSESSFPGTFQFGAYPIVTPITMVLCLITVTRKHKRTQAEKRAMEKAAHLIRKGGDL